MSYSDDAIIKHQLPNDKRYTLFFTDAECARFLRRFLGEDEYSSDDFLIQEAYMNEEIEYVNPEEVLTLVDEGKYTSTFQDEYGRKYYVDHEVVTQYHWHTGSIKNTNQ